MSRKSLKVCIVLTILCLSVFLMMSCAKKHTQVSETYLTPTEEVKTETPGETTAGAIREEDLRSSAAAAEDERMKAAAEAMSLLESQNIYFRYDEYVLDQDARLILDKKADWLLSNPSYSLHISGHCDNRGTNEYNLALGERRANAARDYLVALGVSADRVSTISYGEERPVDESNNEEAWAKNRRAEFNLRK